MSRPQSPGTERAYRADWQLFQDWCQAADVDAITAQPGDVIAFLGENPAGLAGQRRRVAALNWMHDKAGREPAPGRDQAVLDVLHPKRPGERLRREERVARVLEMIPSHGWPTGAFGRRDRALLVLSQRAGLSFEALQNLTRGDVQVTADGLTLGDRRGSVTLGRDPDNAVQCSVCAWARWVRVLDLGAGRASLRPLARALAQAQPVTKASTHQCKVPAEPDPRPDDPVFVPLSRWGEIAFRPAALYATSVGTVVRSHLEGDPAGHDPVNWPWLAPETVSETNPDHEAPAAAVTFDPGVALRDRMAAGARKRALDRDTVSWAADRLDEVGELGDELLHRTEELLALAADTSDALGRVIQPKANKKLRSQEQKS